MISNHVSYLDFVFVGLLGRRSQRFVRFLCRYDAWGNLFAGPAMTAMQHIPVDRAAPAGAYVQARAALRGGEIVGIFPEAGVSRAFTVRALMRGGVALARETHAPLYLAAVWGPQRIATPGLPISLRRGRPLSIRLAGPVPVRPDLGLDAATADVAHRLQQLLEKVQRSHPDQPLPGKPAPWHPAHLGGTAPTAVDADAVADVPRSAVHPPLPSAMF